MRQGGRVLKAQADLMVERAALIPPTSCGLRRVPFLEAFLEIPVEMRVRPVGDRDDIVWLGWGAKRSGRWAARWAGWLGGRAVYLEDGFLRSFGTGNRFPPLSIVVDGMGIYYDSTRPSALETLLASDADVLAGIQDEVARAKALILKHRLSKYNHAPDLDPSGLRPGDTSRVLVVDQTYGDLSVTLGGADERTFATMLAAACAENPHATIYVKTHPEVTSGRKRGYLSQARADGKIVVLRQPVNPLSLIEQMDRVYVVSSTMGFEALLADKPVSCFGLPWYAGWGVTEDRQRCARRTRRRSVDELFAAAYFHYARYLDPLTHRRGTIFEVIEWLLRQRRMAFAA